MATSKQFLTFNTCLQSLLKSLTTWFPESEPMKKNAQLMQLLTGVDPSNDTFYSMAKPYLVEYSSSILKKDDSIILQGKLSGLKDSELDVYWPVMSTEQKNEVWKQVQGMANVVLETSSTNSVSTTTKKEQVKDEKKTEKKAVATSSTTTNKKKPVILDEEKKAFIKKVTQMTSTLPQILGGHLSSMNPQQMASIGDSSSIATHMGQIMETLADEGENWDDLDEDGPTTTTTTTQDDPSKFQYVVSLFNRGVSQKLGTFAEVAGKVFPNLVDCKTKVDAEIKTAPTTLVFIQGFRKWFDENKTNIEKQDPTAFDALDKHPQAKLLKVKDLYNAFPAQGKSRPNMWKHVMELHELMVGTERLTKEFSPVSRLVGSILQNLGLPGGKIPKGQPAPVVSILDVFRESARSFAAPSQQREFKKLAKGFTEDQVDNLSSFLSLLAPEIGDQTKELATMLKASMKKDKEDQEKAAATQKKSS